jgi:hypothetical protein
MNEETMIEILSIGAGLGVHTSGVADLLHRAQAQFGETTTPTAAALQSWAEALKTSAAPHLFAQATPAPAAADISFLSVGERLTRGRPAAPAKRAAPRPLAPEVVADLDKLSPTERLTAYRAMQAGQA